jgi:hypothetical protein
MGAADLGCVESGDNRLRWIGGLLFALRERKWNRSYD